MPSSAERSTGRSSSCARSIRTARFASCESTVAQRARKRSRIRRRRASRRSASTRHRSRMSRRRAGCASRPTFRHLRLRWRHDDEMARRLPARHSSPSRHKRAANAAAVAAVDDSRSNSSSSGGGGGGGVSVDVTPSLSSSGEREAGGCDDDSDVVGYRHCTSFGAWGRNMRFPRMFMEIGGNVRTYPTGLAAQTGTVSMASNRFRTASRCPRVRLRATSQ